MTPRDAAEYLSVHVRTIYRLVKHGEIPGRKVGGSWRFKRHALDKWLSIRENPSSDREDAPSNKEDPSSNGKSIAMENRINKVLSRPGGFDFDEE